MKNKNLSFMTQAAMIAAIYVVLTYIFAPFSFGEVQVRISEALTILPIFTPAAIPGLFVGCLIGFAVGIVQTIPVSKQDSIIKRALLFIVKLILNIYVEVFRGTPMIVQAMFIYFGAMQYLGITMGMWFAAFFIVSINTGAYMAETVRGGILSIDPGQTEGAKAIGMTHFQTMLYVIFPQTLRNIIPQIGNNLIINIKDSSVLSVIGVIELYYAAKQTAGAYYWWFEAMTVAMVL